MAEPSELTEAQRKALIEAVTKEWAGLSDAWDNMLDEKDRAEFAAYFLAGVRWAQKEAARQEDS